jgi:hypothetical protein
MKGDDGDRGDGGDVVLVDSNRAEFDSINGFSQRIIPSWKSISAIPIIPTISLKSLRNTP